MNSVGVGHSQDGGDHLHVLVVGHVGLVVGPVLEARLHDGDGAHGEEGGRLGDTGIGINAFLSVYIHSVGHKKANFYCTVLYKSKSLSS